MLEATTLTKWSDVRASEAQWKDLFANSKLSPFQSWEWNSSWAEQFGQRYSPYVTIYTVGDRVVGILPLVLRRMAWRRLAFMASGNSDILCPIYLPEAEDGVLDASVKTILEVRSHLIDLHQLRANDNLGLLRKDLLFEQARCLLLDLPDTYEEYLKTLGKSLRFDCRRLDKEPFKSGEARVRLLEPSEWEKGLNAFYELHAARWRSRGLPGAFLGKRVQNFHRAWMEKAAPQNMLRLTVLEVGNKIEGVLYAMSSNSTTYFYQMGFNPEHKSLSPGTLLIASSIRQAIEEGHRHFDFLRGDEPYKRRWKPQHEVANLRWLEPRPSFLGNLAGTWTSAAASVESRLRARLEGKGLLG